MCNIKILKIHLCGANFNTLRFLTQRYCFFGLDTFPLVHVLAIVSATSMQSPMNGNLTYLHSLHFHFCPLFCGVGTKLWNILALSHAKTLGPTIFFDGYTFYEVIGQNIYHLFVDGMISLALPLQNMSNYSRTPHPTLLKRWCYWQRIGGGANVY